MARGIINDFIKALLGEGGLVARKDGNVIYIERETKYKTQDSKETSI